jgi:hypothetical protein
MARPGLLAAGFAVALATPVTAFWLIGDRSAQDFAPDELDYAFTPPDWSAASIRTAGIVALVVVLSAGSVLERAVRDCRLDRGWRAVVAVTMAAGLLAALTYRVATAGVIGANMGIGLLVLFVWPAFAVAIVWVAVRAVRLLRRPDAGGSAPAGS